MAVKMVSTASADNFRIAKSKTLTTPAAATYDCIRIPKYAFILNAWLLVDVAGSSNDVQMGFIGNGVAINDDFFLNETDAAVMTVGLKAARTYISAGDYRPFNCLWCDEAGGMVTITIDVTQTTGLFTAFAAFSVIH